MTRSKGENINQVPFVAHRVSSIAASCVSIGENMAKGYNSLVIAIEGPDGVGKTTVARLLTDMLSTSLYSSMIKVRSAVMPYYLRQEIIDNISDMNMFGRIMALLADAVMVSDPYLTKLAPKANERMIVVLDRSVYFSMPAYNFPHLETDERERAAYYLLSMPRILTPDITFILEGEPFVPDDTDIAQLNPNVADEYAKLIGGRGGSMLSEVIYPDMPYPNPKNIKLGIKINVGKLDEMVDHILIQIAESI